MVDPRSASQTVPRTCHLCEAMCGLLLEVGPGQELTSVRGDPDDPLSRGHLCPKAAALKDLQADPDRLERPLVRKGGELREASWEEALDEAAGRIDAVRRARGRHGLALYQGNPTVHSLGAMTYGQVLFRSLGTHHAYSATSADQLPHMLAALKLYGHQLMLPVPDVDRTDLLIVLGADPLVSNGSLMTAPGMKRRLRAVQERGGRVVVVDPRKSRTAEAADEHLFIRPGTDAAFLLALLNVALKGGGDLRARAGRLAPHLDGLERLPALAERFPPERVAAFTGVDAAKIEALGRAFAETPRAALYGRFGVSTQRFGGLCQWLIQALHLACGHLDEEGGMMFPRPAVDLVGLTARAGFAGGFKPAEGERPPIFGGERPVASLVDDLEREDGPRGLMTHAGNPVLSIPNGRRLDEVLPKLDAVVCIDLYLNETTRHADVLLPPASPLTRAHYDLIFHGLAVRDTARFSPPVFERPAHARHDWEIFAGLAARLKTTGRAGRVVRPVAKALLARRPPEDLVALLLRAGPYGGRLGVGGLSLDKLRKNPSGVDLGPLKRALPERLFTKDKRIEVAPAIYLADVERLEAAMERETSVEALVLIGRRSLRSNNSWMHNLPVLMKGKDRCTVWIHPDDAAARSIEAGQRVELSTAAGAITLPAEVTADVMPGVISVPHGFGHGREGTRLSVAAEHAGVSVNDVTSERHTDELCGTAAFSGQPVFVRPVAGPSEPC